MGIVMDGLYKFRACTERNLRAFENKEIFFTPLLDFNDPFEGKFSYCLSNPKLRDAIRQKLGHRLIFCLASPDEKGVLPIKSNLMWTHYAEQHSGFCIKYNENIKNGFAKYKKGNGTDNLQKNIWMNVNYTSSSSITIEKEEDIDIAAPDIIRNKDLSFGYEHEVRLVLHVTENIESKRLQSLAFDNYNEIVSGIYLGCRISIENEIRLLYFCKEHHIRCYQMALKDKDYELDFQEIDVEHLDIKLVNPISLQFV